MGVHKANSPIWGDFEADAERILIANQIAALRGYSTRGTSDDIETYEEQHPSQLRMIANTAHHTVHDRVSHFTAPETDLDALIPAQGLGRVSIENTCDAAIS